MNLKRIHHVAYRCRDAKETVEFYQRVLGMGFVLFGGLIRMGNPFCILALILYFWYITQFQIKPEEKALTKLFGEEYKDYCKRVRRWV